MAKSRVISLLAVLNNAVIPKEYNFSIFFPSAPEKQTTGMPCFLDAAATPAGTLPKAV